MNARKKTKKTFEKGRLAREKEIKSLEGLNKREHVKEEGVVYLKAEADSYRDRRRDVTRNVS